MTKADTNKRFTSSEVYRDNFDKIFYVREEGAVADLTNDINDKRIYQKDNSDGSDFKEDIGTI
jgi:hypothetical protein